MDKVESLRCGLIAGWSEVDWDFRFNQPACSAAGFDWREDGEFASVRSTKRQNKEGARLMPIPGALFYLEDTNNTDNALYGVGRVSKPKVDLERKYANRPRKMGAERPPSAKLLILQGGRHSLNSNGSGRRDNMSLR
jgi:hypothetical protein